MFRCLRHITISIQISEGGGEESIKTFFVSGSKPLKFLMGILAVYEIIEENLLCYL